MSDLTKLEMALAQRDDLLKANEILQALVGNRDKEIDRLRGLAQPPSKEKLFCHWLKGYIDAVTGRDELTAFEANTIRNTLNELISSAEPACGNCSQASQHHSGDLQPGSAEASSVSSTDSKYDGADDLEHLDGMLDDRERG